MGFAVEMLDFKHVCLTKSGESGKDCKGVAAQKDKRERCDCVVTHASSFVFYPFRNWEPVELL